MTKAFSASPGLGRGKQNYSFIRQPVIRNTKTHRALREKCGTSVSKATLT